MKKIILVACLIVSFALRPACADEIFRAAQKMDFVDLQIAAVSIEMYGYLGWFADDKKAMHEGAKQAIADLESLKVLIKSMQKADDLKIAGDLCLESISMLQAIYSGIEEKSSDEIKSAFEEFNKKYDKFQEELRAVYGLNKTRKDLSEDHDPWQEEITLAKDQGDKETYAAVREKINQKEYEKAYKLLEALQAKYSNGPFADCILLRMSDCLNMEGGISGKENSDGEEGIKMLDKIMNGGSYSPVLYEAFYKWRTMTQSCWHGTPS